MKAKAYITATARNVSRKTVGGCGGGSRIQQYILVACWNVRRGENVRFPLEHCPASGVLARDGTYGEGGNRLRM